MLKRKAHTLSVGGSKKISLHNVNTLPESATIVIQENGEQVATVYQDDGTGVPIGGTVISSDGTEMLHFAPSEHTIIEEVPMDPEVGEQAFYGEASNIIVEATDDQQHLLEGADEEGALHVALDDDLEQQVVETEQLPLETQIEHVSVEDVGAQDSETPLEEEYESADTPPYQNIIVQHMDISEPLTTLRKLLEQRLHCSLGDHEFYLQDTLPLDANKSLVQQRVDGSGMVQVNIEVKSQPGIRPILNIVDILKPAEEMPVHPTPEVEKPVSPVPNTSKVIIPFPEEAANVTRWIVDQNFRKEQDRLKIPFDPELWSEVHVRHWIQWAIKEFNLRGVDVNNFVSGKQLCEMKHDEFIKLIPSDKGDIFWTHLELLRKCKFVAVIQQPTPHAITTITVSTSDTSLDGRGGRTYARPRGRCITLPGSASGNRTGNNGQIQLWQFLLELLTDKDCQEIIHWVGDEGEFKLSNQEMVAQLWGQRKNKPTMNYEKLSRALRYYYDGDMIAKVHGKRFVYKFVCDLRTLLGYSAAELNHLVSECAERKHNGIPSHQRPQVHNIFRKRPLEIPQD